MSLNITLRHLIPPSYCGIGKLSIFLISNFSVLWWTIYPLFIHFLSNGSFILKCLDISPLYEYCHCFLWWNDYVEMMIMMMMILYLLCLFMLACKVVCCSPSKCFLWSCLSLLSSSSSPLSSSSSSSSSTPSPMSTHKRKQKWHLNDANVKIHHKRVDFSGLPILPEPPRDVEQDRLEEEINIFVNLYSILTGISHEMPRTPSIVTDNKSLNLVWFKWGSQWWGIVKHFPQSRCILISHWAIEK